MLMGRGKMTEPFNGTFRVDKCFSSGVIRAVEVTSDGYDEGESEEQEQLATIVLGYKVEKYDHLGDYLGAELYPVQTIMKLERGDFCWTDNRGKVFAAIKKRYSPENGWQNNNW